MIPRSRPAGSRLELNRRRNSTRKDRQIDHVGRGGRAMSRDRTALTALVIFLSCLLAESARSQTTGAIGGRVTDSSGGALPGAAVEARSASLQGVRSATTDGRGGYRILALPPGTYTVKASLP